MREHWNHGELGSFEYEAVAWKKMIDVPAFMAFRYVRESPSDDLYELTLEAVPDELPSAEQIDVALRLLANQEKLVEAMKKSLWDGFLGRGPESEMWWYGNLDEVNQVLTAELGTPVQLREQDGLLDIMIPTVIKVRKWVLGYNKPVAEVYFFAAFAHEHGVGILTDGEVVLGIGYSGEAEPFNPES